MKKHTFQLFVECSKFDGYYENEYGLYVTAKDLHKILSTMDYSEFYYHYSLLGALEFIRLNEKSITTLDGLGNKVYFRLDNKYKFYLNCFGRDIDFAKEVAKEKDRILQLQKSRRRKQEIEKKLSERIEVEIEMPNKKVVKLITPNNNKLLLATIKKNNLKVIAATKVV